LLGRVRDAIAHNYLPNMRVAGIANQQDMEKVIKTLDMTEIYGQKIKFV